MRHLEEQQQAFLPSQEDLRDIEDQDLQCITGGIEPPTEKTPLLSQEKSSRSDGKTSSTTTKYGTFDLPKRNVPPSPDEVAKAMAIYMAWKG
jgi:hypothetical protein